MTLAFIILIPAVAGILAWGVSRWSNLTCRWLTLVGLTVDLALCAGAMSHAWEPPNLTPSGRWLLFFDKAWIPQLEIRFQLGMDALSLWMALLTIVIGAIAVIASWTEIQRRVGFFHFQMMLAISGVLGVFLALDLFLFYSFWELMIVPTYFLIAIWGDNDRRPAATRFFLFTQAGGLLMLVGILALYFIHGSSTGTYTFAYSDLLRTPMSRPVSLWLALAFAAGFLVKVPAVPFHTWLPRAYASAPTGASILLAALLSKTGAYGLIRFITPLFPEGAGIIAPYVIGLGVAGVLYGGLLAFAQRDLKRLVAYSSLSHLGFVLIGVFAWTPVSLQGTVMQMIAHGVSVAGLFMLAGLIQQRIGTRDLMRMGGFWIVAGRMGAAGLIFALATLGLPGLGNFVGEYLVLAGSFGGHPVLTSIAAVGFVFSVIYALWMVQGVFQGPTRTTAFADMNWRESGASVALIILALWLGLYPAPVFDTLGTALEGVRQAAPIALNALTTMLPTP